MAKSKIEWTETTWNPLTGCTKISPGCQNCYAEKMAKRLQSMGNPNYRDGFKLAIHPHVLNYPFKWKKPNIVFVNSMSDLFHEDVPLSFIQEVFSVMRSANWHVFQVLTKRSTRLMELDSELSWPENVWMGVSVENSDYLYRLDRLRSCSATVKFVSFEPLLGSVQQADLNGLDWVIAGGESGPKARPMAPEWALQLRDICQEQKVPFFFKQWGGVNKKKAGRLLQGRIWDEMPRYNSASALAM